MQTDTFYLTLSETDKAILESYKKMIVDLGAYLGEGYEIILHSLENLQHSVIENVNGCYSGRANGAPITDLALSMLNKIQQEESSPNICYMNYSKQGVPLRSSTIPILGEHGRIIGLICINFYTNLPLSSLLAKFSSDIASTVPSNPLQKENFAENTDELIENVLQETRNSVLNDLTICTQNKNREIVAQLYHKGIFNIKDAVIKVSALLGISKNTVYMHLRNMKAEENQ